MKKLIYGALTLSLLAGQVHAFQSPDVLVDTRIKSDWSGVLVTKIRKLMKSMGQPDPFHQQFAEPFTVSEGLVKDYLNPEAKELLTDLGHMLDMDFLNGKTQVVLENFQYEVQGFKTDLHDGVSKKGSFSITSDFAASKVQVKAEKLILSLVIPGKKALPVINIEILKPVISAYEENLINFFATLQVQDKGPTFGLSLEQADFSTLANNLVDDSNAIQLDVAGISVPKVSVKIGNKELKFDPKKIEALLLSKKEGIKGLLVAQVSSLLTGNLVAEKMKKGVSEVKFVKEHWVESSGIESMVRIASFQGNENGESVKVNIEGDFCTSAKYGSDKEKCLNTKLTQSAKSRITEQMHQASLDEMSSLFNHGDANIVVSISEDYVNKGLAAAYDAGMWDPILSQAGVVLGPNKAFLIMDDKGSNSGTLYMDVLYTPKKLERLAVGTKEVRFPLAMKVRLQIKEEKGVPVFKISLTDLDVSDQMLLNGRPDLGLPSNINKLRFKKKVLSTIREETKDLNNKEMANLPFPKLRGLGLDEIEFVADGFGRLNALILIKDTSGHPREI